MTCGDSGGCAGGLGAVWRGGGVGYLWIRARAAVRLAEIDEEALSTQLQVLPPGSRISKRRPGQSETVVQIGGLTGSQGGLGGYRHAASKL